ncbi:MAG: hypothetical protein RLZZ440_2444 [Planctomycetota bacterium]
MAVFSVFEPVIAAVIVLAGGVQASAEEPAGRRDLRIHDPTPPIQDAAGEWWIFGTGRMLLAARSADLVTWERQPSPLGEPPAWAAEVAPGNRRHHYWAPDVVRSGDQFFLYYSVSEFGRQTSAIGLATAAAAAGPWRDRGVVIRSRPGDPFNAIDPAVLLDEGRLWMAFGSFWQGIFLVELDPETGLRKTPAAEPVRLAWAREIEAATLHRRGEWYYLFVNHGLCCRGVQSTYRVLVGRSRSIAGPYLDDAGRPLLDGGGRPVVGSEGNFIGPGHLGLFRGTAGDQASMHFYDGAREGRPTLAIRRVRWTSDGWPELVPE